MDDADDAARERGQALPLVALLVVAAAVLGLVVVRVGVVVESRARARTAADAAALAGVTGGRPAATRYARLNDGELTSFVQVGTQVEVHVRVAGQEAVARAEAA